MQAKIQMVDLLGQYQNMQQEIDEAVLRVVRSSAYINGPEVHAFQEEMEEYLNVNVVIPCANGTDALQIALMSLDLKEGDEVILPNFTYVATAEVVGLLKLKPVLVDVDPSTFNVDPKAIEAAITPKTKAIVPVHLYGQCADMEAIMELANQHQLFVIEDAAQSIGAEYIFSDGTKKHAGTIGTIGCTSFFPSKNLGCYGDGGAIFTNDEQLAQKIRMIANHGQSKRYYHDKVGVNSRLDSIQAAILRVKLKRLDSYIQARNAAASFYDAAFENVEELQTPFRAKDSTHAFHQYTLKTTGIDRNNLKEHLEASGVSAMIYYPVPLHHQKAYQSEQFSDDQFPVTMDLCPRVISLPMHTELTEEQLSKIAGEVIEYTAKVS